MTNDVNNMHPSIKPIRAKTLIKLSILKYKECGRKQIKTKEELDNYPIGSAISYLNVNDELRKCGFLVRIEEEYFTFIEPEFKKKFRVRYENIKKMWIGDVYKTTNDIVSITETTQKPTKLPVKVGKIIVYYAIRRQFKIKYKMTDKYARMMKWYKYFNGK